MKERLFSDFKPVTRRHWIDKMVQDLKGFPYEKLIWSSPEGIPVEPAYTRENLLEFADQLILPGDFPFIRGYKTKQSWNIRQDIPVTNPAEANMLARQALDRGAESLGFIYPERPEPCIGMDGLLENIDLSSVSVFFENNFHPYALFTGLKNAAVTNHTSFQKMTGAIAFDPLEFLALYGDYPSTESGTLNRGKELLEEAETDFPGIYTLAVHASVFNHAGGNAAQEIGYALAAGNEYLSFYTGAGIPLDTLTRHLFFHFATSGNFFMEIAKFRAFRLLWTAVIKAWQPKDKNSFYTYIHSETTVRNKTLYDPYVNILRSTTEAISSILGGIDSLTIYPYDQVLKAYNKTSANIAQNIQLILKQESRFNKVTDAPAGSYYIEKLTEQLANKAWDIFQSVEREGGYRKALQHNTIQTSLKNSLEQRLKNLATRKEILVGTNHYPNTHENMTDLGEADQLLVSRTPEKKKRIQPVEIRRFSEVYENLRLSTELSGKKPVFYLFGFGTPAIRTARETFAINLLGCAGFTFPETPPSRTLEKHIETIHKIKPDIVVLCGEDEGYPKITDYLNDTLTYSPILVVAGYPEDLLKKLQSKGIRFFLHRKVNVPEILKQLQEAVHVI